MNMLIPTDVKELRDDIYTLVRSSISRRAKLVEENKITKHGSQEIKNKEDELLDKAEQLTNQLSGQIITDIEEPRKEIQTTIGKLEDAIEKIHDVNQFFAKLEVAFNIFATLVSAVGSSPSVAIREILNKVTD